MKALRVALLVGVALMLALTGAMLWLARDVVTPEGIVQTLRSAPRLAAGTIEVIRREAPLRRWTGEPVKLGFSRVRVCGGGEFYLPVPQREAEAAVSAAIVDPLGQRVAARLVPTLQGAADDHDRALGHFIAMWLGIGEGRAHREALATLAVHTRDPRAYALAVSACGSGDEPPCRQVSSERWAQLDPDNAAPWLRIAEQAAESGDSAGVADALFRMSRARRIDLVSSGAARVLQHPAIVELPTLDRMALTTVVYSIWGSIHEPGLERPMKHCKDAALDANRRELCDALASMFIERDGTLFGLGMGLRLAEQAGWEPERRQRLKDESQALNEEAARAAFAAPTYSCEWQRGVEHRDTQVAALGEIAAARRSLAERTRAPR